MGPFTETKPNLRKHLMEPIQQVLSYFSIYSHCLLKFILLNSVDSIYNGIILIFFFIHCYLETLQHLGHIASRAFGCVP